MQKNKKEEEEKKKKGDNKGADQNAKKREKKVYKFTGQKRDPPEEVMIFHCEIYIILVQYVNLGLFLLQTDALRIFYETLYKQVPNSEMAAIW